MDDIQACLANNMKRYRKKNGLSQERLAEKAGASANYIALIESGKNFPSLAMLRQIAASLGIDALDLFDRAALDYPDREKVRSETISGITQLVNEAFDRLNGLR